MKKDKTYSAQYKIISEQLNQNQPNTASLALHAEGTGSALHESAKNRPNIIQSQRSCILRKKLSKKPRTNK